MLRAAIRNLFIVHIYNYYASRGRRVNITFKQWVSVDPSTLETYTKPVDEFVDICEKLEVLRPHAFIAVQQASFYCDCKSTLAPREMLVTVDFSENYYMLLRVIIGIILELLYTLSSHITKMKVRSVVTLAMSLSLRPFIMIPLLCFSTRNALSPF